MEASKGLVGVSTKAVEDARKTALVKVFDNDYKTCYNKTLIALKKMGNVSIYARDRQRIAFYYIDPNTTPVGVFFKKVDDAHTQVEISSQSSTAKESVAKYIFYGANPKEATAKAKKSALWSQK
jgi:hypothetical protein